jgi:hypothetical protein
MHLHTLLLLCYCLYEVAGMMAMVMMRVILKFDCLPEWGGLSGPAIPVVGVVYLAQPSLWYV